MNIVQYYPGLIPPPDYGGIERVVYWLTRELVRQGHTVTVIADGRSRIAEAVPGARLIPIPEVCPDYRALIPRNAEIVHLHVIPPLDRLPDCPYLITEHGNRNHFNDYAPNTVFVSKSHAKNHGAKDYVNNGVPRDEFPLCRSKRKQMVFMAKLDWRAKNAKTAINLSLDSGMPLKLAGGDMWRTRKLWGTWMARIWLHRSLIDNVGMVAGQRKLDLLQQSRLLFYLVNWEEPGALAIIEALSCGTPALVTPNGVLPEYIRHGENGFIVSNYAQALECLAQVASMSEAEIRRMSEACHELVFTSENTAKRYVDYYQRVIAEGLLYSEEQRLRIRFVRPNSVKIKR